MGRLGSQRCPNKMLKAFSNTTLTDIILSKLSYFENSFFAGFENIFEEKCKQHNVNFVRRSKRSIEIDKPIVEILEFLNRVDYDKILFVSGCLPLLKIETIERFLTFCNSDYDIPATLYIRRNNYFVDKNFNPINFDKGIKTINTKNVEPIYEFANALYYYNRKEFLMKGRYWSWDNVRCSVVDGGKEFIDVDTEEDFYIAESIYGHGCFSNNL